MSNKIETERIINLNEFEKIIQEARADIRYLRLAFANDSKETAAHIVEKLDLKLHQLEVFDFQIERRTIIEHDHSECQ